MLLNHFKTTCYHTFPSTLPFYLLIFFWSQLLSLLSLCEKQHTEFTLQRENKKIKGTRDPSSLRSNWWLHYVPLMYLIIPPQAACCSLTQCQVTNKTTWTHVLMSYCSAAMFAKVTSKYLNQCHRQRDRFICCSNTRERVPPG